MPTEAPERPSTDELRSALLEEGDRLRELRSKPDDERSENWLNDIRRTGAIIGALDSELIAQTRDEEQRALAQLSEARGPQAAFGEPFGETRTAGQMFIESDQYQNRSGVNTEGVEVRNLLQSIGTASGSNLFSPIGTPYLSQGAIRQQRLFVRDLISVQPTNLTSVPYIRELTPATYETGATAVAEGSAKPEVTMAFVQDDAPLRKLAAWIQLTTEAIEDSTTLSGYVDNRLGYMLLLREEAQLLNGPGVGVNIKGITQFADVQTQSAVSGDVAATLGRAIGKVEAVDGDADGIAMHPTDYWTMVTTRHANAFNDGYSTGAPDATPAKRAWGIPVVTTRSMTAGTALVGAFRLGATVFQRQGITIRTSDSHSTNFVANITVVLAEERVGLAVHRPDFFVVATL